MKRLTMLLGLLSFNAYASDHEFSVECEHVCEANNHGELIGWTQDGSYGATCECADRALLKVRVPDHYEPGVNLYFVDPFGVRVYYNHCCYHRPRHYLYDGYHRHYWHR